MLELYRAALRIRKLSDDELSWHETAAQGAYAAVAAERVLAFSRPGGFSCVLNLSEAAVPLPPHNELLLASGPLDDGRLPPDTAAWLRTGAS